MLHHRAVTVALSLGFLLSAPGSGVTQETPLVLQPERDPSGLKLSWNASLGMDFALESTDDLLTYQAANLVTVQQNGRFRVLVPPSQPLRFYRLINDGVRRQAAYTGSDACRSCHLAIHNSFLLTGHPFQLSKVSGSAPVFPFSRIRNPPPGHTWQDISWMVGGAVYRAHFVDRNGHIITGTNAQWNRATERWAAFRPESPPGTQPYDCGACHTTGWMTAGDGAVRQDGLPGMIGSFAAPGVQCEACHGPGSRHVQAPEQEPLARDRSSTLCAQCHSRGPTNTIRASDGFIEYHAEFNELLAAGHASLSCTGCHDPHASVKHGQTAGIRQDCVGCHSPTRYAQDFHSAFAKCTDCHMPKLTKIAEAVNKYTADIQTHIFKINTAPDAQMFTADGLLAHGAAGVTLAHVCYSCHKDPDGVGGRGSTRTLQQLSTRAQNFHEP